MRSEERSYKYYLAITLQYYFAPDSPQSVTQALSSTMASHSTGTPRGSPLLPTALLLLFPAGPNTSMNKLARPFTTAGCFVYSDEGRGRVGVELKGASGVELKGIACWY